MQTKRFSYGLRRAGLIAGMPEAEYHSAGSMDECSYHIAKATFTSMAHARYFADNPDLKDSPAKRFGRAVHAAVLQPDRYDELVVVMPKGKKRDNTKWYIELKAENPGRDILTYEEQLRIDDIQMRVAKHPTASSLMNPDELHTEVSGFFTDPETLVSCRLRLDAYNARLRYAVDVKTAAEVTDHALERAFDRFGYPGQQAWYTEGLELLDVDVDAFVFLIIESDFPHTVRVETCSTMAVSLGAEDNLTARMKWAEALDSGEWPGPGEGVGVIDVPAWRKKL